MAEKDKNVAEQSKKKLPIRTALIVSAVLFAEVATVGIAYWALGGPAEVRADGAAVDAAMLAEQPVEILVVEDKFQNTRTGRAYLYDTEIYIVVTKKHEGEVQKSIESMSAQITTDIATIFRRSEPAHLLEPELSTLSRQINAALDARLGQDDQGESFVQEVLIRKCMQFRADV